MKLMLRRRHRAPAAQDTSQTRPSTAANPTKLCSIATSSGIDVICTRDASMPPINQPGNQAAAKHRQPAGTHCRRRRDQRDQHPEMPYSSRDEPSPAATIRRGSK